MSPRNPQTLEEAREELRLVIALARRIHRDLGQALDDVPECHPLWRVRKERYDYFARMLGDTSEYRHELHRTIQRLSAEVDELRRQNALLQRMG